MSIDDVRPLRTIRGLKEVLLYGPIVAHENFLRSEMTGQKSGSGDYDVWWPSESQDLAKFPSFSPVCSESEEVLSESESEKDEKKDESEEDEEGDGDEDEDEEE